MTGALITRVSGACLLFCSVAGLPAQDEAPSATEVQRLLEEMDRCFGQSDVEQFMACFRPVHAELHGRFAQRIQQVFAYDVELARSSRVEADWILGRHRVSLVRAETSSIQHPDREPMVEHALLAARLDDQRNPRAAAWIEVDAGFLGMLPEAEDDSAPRHTLRCHACNYTIDAGDGWLMVPNLKDRVGCLESLSFYSLDSDLVADLTVHMARADRAPDSRIWLREIAAQSCPDAQPELLPIEPWLPPAYGPAMPPPARLDSVRCDIPLGVPGQGARVHLAVYGRLGYLISVHGSRTAIEENEAAVEDLLSSFSLIDPDLDPAQLEVRILEERMGSTLDGAAFSNRRFGVRFPGIDGWQTRLDAGPYAFDATWMCPRQRGRFRIRGLEPPRGFGRWTPQAADMVLAPMLRELGLFAARRSTDWRESTDSAAKFRWRLDLEGHQGDRPGARHRAVRIRLASDLLVVLDAETDDVEELRTLQRRSTELTR